MLLRFLRHSASVILLTTCSTAFSVPSEPNALRELPNAQSSPQADFLWTTRHGPAPFANEALAMLNEAASHGLDPVDYQVDRLNQLHDRVTQGDTDLRLEYEGLMTDALLRLFRDLRPQLVRDFGGGNSGNEMLTLIVLEAVRSDALADFYASLLPRHSQYTALRAALSREMQAPADSGVAAIGPGPALSPGDTGTRVQALRARLLPERLSGNSEEDEFDELLEDAVKAYQLRNGLEADGIVGKRTQRHLDMSALERAARIRVALARWRELPAGLGAEYVHVNIPEYRLEMIRDGQTHVEMKVVVGSRDNPTPAFNDEIEYLVFNPYWHVPRSIALEELVPKALESPGYLTKQNYEILLDGEIVQESAIDWAVLDNANFGYRIRQRPGPGNALGAVKFLFPNASNIYLHDSPARSLYERTVRAFSHGCIRLEDPVALAEALLEEKNSWTEDRIDQTMSTGSRRQINLDSAVPVYLTYITAKVTDSGELALFEDIYGRDRALLSRFL